MKSSARSCLRAVFRQGSDYAGSGGLSQQLVKRRAGKDGGRPVRYTGSVTKLRQTRMKTNREIEVKLPVDDVRELVRRMRQIGARNHGRVLEQNTLYDTPASDFRLRGRLLRLRIETSPSGKRRALMTSKTPAPPEHSGAARSRYNERLEREVWVRDPIRADWLLRSLGLRPGFRYEKYRTSFRMQGPIRGLHLDLDETPVGVFLELEGRPAAIDRVARMLGFAPRDYIRGTYWDVNAAACRRKGRKPGNMLFARKNLPKRALFA
jgi:adenylate cyclase class IV